MPAQVIIKLIADPTGLQPGIDSLEQLGQIDQSTAADFKATNKAFQDRSKVMGSVVDATGKLSTASKVLAESITGGAITQASANIDKLNSKFHEGGKATEAFVQSIALAKQELEQLDPSSADFTKLSNEIDAATKSFEQLSAGATNPTERLKQLEGTLESLTASGLQETEVFDGLKREADALGTAIDGASQDYAKYAKAVELAKNKLAGLQQGTPEFKKTASEIEAAELAMGNLAEEATSTRGRLRQLRETLIQLEDAGLDGTQVFNDIAEAAGELSDQVGDTQARIQVLASDTFKFDVAIQAVQGVAGAFSVAQGAAALFGSENEDLQKALLKVNAAMSILSGLQAIQNILQSESALYIGATIALQRIQVLQTNLQAASESRFIIVRYAAIIAQRALNLVMSANPAGVVLYAIAALATALYAFTRGTEDASEAQKKLNQQLETSIKISQLSSKVIQQQADVTIATLKKQNASSQALRDAETQALRDQTNVAYQLYQKANNNLSLANSKEKEERDKRISYLRAHGISEEAINNLILKSQDKYTEERLKALQMQQEAAQNYFDLQNKLQVKSLENQKSAQEDALKNASAFAQAKVAQTKKDSIAETQAEKNAIQVRLQEQLNAEGLLEGERAQLIAEANRQILDLNIKAQQQLLDKQISIAKSNELEKRDAFQKLEAGTTVLILQAQKDKLGKSKEDAILIETQKNEAIKNLRESLFKDLERIDNVFYGNLSTRQKTASKEEIKQQVLTSAGVAQARLQAKQAQAQEDISSDEKRVADAKALRERLIETEINLVSSLSSSLNEIAKNRSDYELTLLQNDQDKRAKALQQQLDQGTITQQEYNRRSLAMQEDFDRKSRAIKIRAAQQEKQLALFQAFIAQSLAVLSVLKDQTIPFAIKPIFIGLALTQAIAQIAAIASKPIPAFKKGTKNAPGGPALIGEAGPELFYANGTWGYASGPTVLDLPKGSKVVPSLDTEKILQRYDIPMPKVPAHMEHTVHRERIDYRKIGIAVGTELQRIPVNIFGYDDDGPWRHTTTMQNRDKFLRKRYGRK